MTCPLRKLSSHVLRGLLAASVAATTMTVPASAAPYITTGVHSAGGGTPDVLFQFIVGGAPPFAPVTLDFSGCSHFWLSAVQPMPAGFPAIAVACGGHKVTTAANGLGVATFRIVASSNNPNGALLPPSACPCALATSGAIALGAYCVATVDQDNVTGVGVADIGSVITDVIYSQTHLPVFFPRSDFEGDGDTDAADLGKLVNIYLNLVVSGTDGSSCGDPGGACCPLIP
jgi:hypothetical protein